MLQRIQVRIVSRLVVAQRHRGAYHAIRKAAERIDFERTSICLGFLNQILDAVKNLLCDETRGAILRPAFIVWTDIIGIHVWRAALKSDLFMGRSL